MGACVDATPGITTFVSRSTIGPTLNGVPATGAYIATRANQEIQASGVDWVLLSVARPTNAGTRNAAIASTYGYTFATAVGTANNAVTQVSGTPITAATYYTGINSSGVYGAVTASTAATDLTDTVAIQLAYDGVTTSALATQIVVTSGSVIALTGVTFTKASTTVTYTANTAVLASVAYNIYFSDTGNTNAFYTGVTCTADATTPATKCALGGNVTNTPVASTTAWLSQSLIASTTNYTAGKMIAASSTAIGAASNIVVVDVSDYTANLVFSFNPVVAGGITDYSAASSTQLGGAYNSGIPAYTINFTVGQFQVPNGINVTISPALTCTNLDTSGTSTLGAQYFYNCQMTLGMPGRQYNISPRLQLNGNNGAALGGAISFIASSQRPAQPGTSSPHVTQAPKNSYYYATATGSTYLYRAISANPASIGHGGYGLAAYGSAPWRMPAGAVNVWMNPPPSAPPTRPRSTLSAMRWPPSP